jgi:6-phosphogluconolactonase (cycloisomerase 2 family)
LSIRNSIARIKRFIPAVFVTVCVALAIANSGGCGKGLFPEINSANATATATPVANAFLYATNFSDGTVSAFQRNTTNGRLSFVAKQNAGAVNGPVGVAVTKQNDLAFVANAADGKVYEYTIVQSGTTPGNLATLGNINAGTTPQQVAIDQMGNFVYVTNAGSRTVSEYAINSLGTLTLIGTLSGFSGKPFGITAHPTAQFVYVTDNTAGLIYTFTINSDGTLTQFGNPVPSNGLTPGLPGLMAIAIDSTQGYLFSDDTFLGTVSVFVIQSNGSLLYASTFGVAQSNTIGIGAANNGGGSGINYVLTANMAGNFVQPYQRTAAMLTQAVSVGDSTGPTGLVVDPASQFAYTANSGSGTIALIGMNAAQCGTNVAVCVITAFNSETPANANAGTQFLATTH